MTDQHPITPPPELVQQWIEETRSHDCIGAYPADLEQCVATRAAQWGADKELEACCEYAYERLKLTTAACIAQELRAARRPKPPSLKEQALEALEAHFAALQAGEPTYRPSYKEVIRRALEALPE
jgi:hypothetical protein